MGQPIDLWTEFNGRKLAAERARYDWRGNEIVAPNDSTITIKVADASTGPTAGSFTTNQNSAGTITIPAAASATGGGSATPGVMSSSDKEKLDGIAQGATKVEEDIEHYGSILVNGSQVVVYVHPDAGPSAVTSVGDTTDQTPGFGGTFKVTSETVDTAGHTTVIAEHNVTIPSATASASTGGQGGSAGLMSAADKEKLNGIETGAQVNVKPDWNAASGAPAEILNKPSIPAAANDAALNLVLGTAQATTVFSANASSTGTISIPLASVDTSGSTPAYTAGLMTGQDKEHLDNATAVIPQAATAQNPLVDTAAMQAAIANLGGYEVVSNSDPSTHEPILPSGETASTKIIYLVKNTSAPGDDKYYEWICTNTTGPVWELIGETSINLTGYAENPSSKITGNIVEFGAGDVLVDSGKTVSQLENVVTTFKIGTGSATGPDTGTTNITIPMATSSVDGAMSASDKSKLDGITDYLVSASVSSGTLTLTPKTGNAVTFTGDVNVIESISVNGTGVTPDANKNVALLIPVAASVSDTPVMDGTAAVGVSDAFARADHVHPSDTDKADKVVPAATGNFASLDVNGNLADSGVSEGSFVKGVKLAGASTALTPSSGVVTIPDAIATGTTGASNGLMTANQAQMLEQIGAWTWSYAAFSDSGMGTESTSTFPFTVPSV